MNPCRITEDLLPLYVEGVCSEDSKEYVEAHLKECPACRALRDGMSKSVQTIVSSRNAKNSFRLFKRRLLFKRILLITLCVLVSFALLTAIFYRPLEDYLSGPQLVRTSPFISEVSRLSDGSIHISLQYDAEDVYVNMQKLYPHPQDERTLVIEMGWNRLNTWDSNLKNGGSWHTFLVLTDESAPLYNLKNAEAAWNDRAYDKVVLVGSDGERVLWEKGDSLPAAEARAEDILQRHLEYGLLLPVTP